MTAADYEAAGLYDPAAPGAPDRLALLEFLEEQGVGIEQMRRAHRGGHLTAAAADALIRPGRELRIEEAASASGLTADQIRRVLVAGGVVAPGSELRFVDSDVQTFAMFRTGMELFGEDATLSFTRVLGTSMARIAEAAISLFQVNVQAGLSEQGAGEVALARANLSAVGSLGAVDSAMQGLLRWHFEAALARSRRAYSDEDPFGSRRLAVGFVDLVGFTPLAHRLDDQELAALIEEFESRAHAVVTVHDGRVVKHMGDEVMFVAVGGAAACEIALAMVDAFRAADARIEPHGALAVGGLLTRGGDYYGPVVNLAARVAEIAVPGEILVSEELHRAAVGAAGFEFEPAGRRMLKGFSDPVPLWSLRRAEP